MTHDWAELGTDEDRSRKAGFLERARLGWRSLTERPTPSQLARFCDGVWVERHQPGWVVRWREPHRRPLAESVVRTAPPGEVVLLGLPGAGWEVAVDWVRRTHRVDLTSAEVRVGVTRGHLLAIVISIPLDVDGGAEDLQSAAERLCERALGEVLLDRWVVSIDVVRSARRSKLAVLQAGDSGAAQTHPGDLLCDLVERGITGVLSQVPETQLRAPAGGWTALHLEPHPGGLQEDRLQVFTCVPEALKCALEGLPFDSARFTRGPEVLIWCSWALAPLDERLLARELAEKTIGDLFAERALVCGSGFGPSRDFLDLWILPEASLLSALREHLAARLGTHVELGFYDGRWSAERLRFP